MVAGALRQLGIVRASEVDELIDVGEALALTPLRAAVAPWTSGGRRHHVGRLRHSRGRRYRKHGLVLADLSNSTVEALGGIVPSYGSVANPVDVTATVMRTGPSSNAAWPPFSPIPASTSCSRASVVLVGATTCPDAIVTALDKAARASGKQIVVARTGAGFLAPAGDDSAMARIPQSTYPRAGQYVSSAHWAGRQARAKARASPPSRGLRRRSRPQPG